MYHMKNIVSNEPIVMPKCMYHIKNTITSDENFDVGINIRDQESPNKHMLELEARQDKLLLKLDNLYEKIKNISSMCKLNDGKIEPKIQKPKTNKSNISLQQEIVITVNPDNLPWYLNIFLAKNDDLNVTWHIHSSVSNEKISKILAFLKRFQKLYPNKQDTRSNIRLIFKDVSSAPELKMTSLDIPIIGTVNILRYLCSQLNNDVLYNSNDHMVDNLLDLCHLLERTSDRNKEHILNKVFSSNKIWIYDNQFTVVDLAFYSVSKQVQKSDKYVPKEWLANCEKVMCS